MTLCWHAGIRTRHMLIAGLAVLSLALTACGSADEGTADDGGATADAEGPLTVYSGRSEELVGPLLDEFTAATGIEVQVRYGDTAELAATILEEGSNTPADVFFAQDAGALGALQRARVLAELDDEQLQRIDSRFVSPTGAWVGVSGRVRTIVHNTDTLPADDAPTSVFDLTDERWQGKVGWAPTNGSFQAFVTAMRLQEGDERTREWVEAMIANGTRAYEKNTPIVEAVGRGEIELGLVNHYYLLSFLEEEPGFPAANAFLEGDVGGIVNVAGVGVLHATDQPSAAAAFVDYLLSEDAQRYFATETYEYPLVGGIPADERLPTLESLRPPAFDLSNLDDLEGTLELLRQSGALS